VTPWPELTGTQLKVATTDIAPQKNNIPVN
jgi:hypothetical protein